MSTLFRFVLVGSGNISRTYFLAVQALGAPTITGLVSRSPESAGVSGNVVIDRCPQWGQLGAL